MNLEKENLLQEQKEEPKITEESIRLDIKYLGEQSEKMELKELRKIMKKIISEIFDFTEGKDETCEECGIRMAGELLQCPPCGTKLGFSKPANKGVA